MEAYTERSPPATTCLTVCLQLCKAHSGCHTFSSFDFLYTLMEQMLLITSLFHRLKKKTYRGWLNNSFQALTSKIGLCKIKIQTTGWYSPCQNGYNVTQNGRVHSDSYRNWFQVQGIPNRKDRILPTKPEYIYPRRKLEVTMYCLDQTVPTKTPCFQSSWYDSNTLHFLKNVSLWGSTFASFRIISTENPHPVLGVPELGQQICRMMRLLSCTLRFLYHCLYVF